jgi:iron(III) transport system substrate-binding protein
VSSAGIRVYILIVVLLAVLSQFACTPARGGKELVVYTSVDQVYSEPVFMEYEKSSGIHILPVYDVEAAKTTGLVNRLIAEKGNPRADVFWSGEFAQTILLREEGVLDTIGVPNASDIPSHYRDPDGYWYGFAGRARVLLVNTDLLSQGDYPTSIFDLLEPSLPAEKLGIAYPLFGTTATQAAALYAALGPDEARDYFQSLNDRGIRVVDGNSVVRDLVVSGQLVTGLTDTDDSCTAILKGEPVAIVFPDQDDLGTLIIPNTVALINGAPHASDAGDFINYLLSREVAESLIASGWSHVPLRPISITPDCVDTGGVRGMDVSLVDVYNQLERAKTELAEIFIR